MAFNPDIIDSMASAMTSLSVNHHQVIFVKVEDMIYPFPDEHFRRCNFERVTEHGTNGNGASQQSPIILRDGLVSAEELEAVLEIFGIRNSEYADNLITLSASAWLSALKLANLWDYRELRSDAIAYLDSNTGFRRDTRGRIQSGIDLWVKPWVFDGCTYLIRRALGADAQAASRVAETLRTIMIALYDLRETQLTNPDISLDAAIKALFELFVQGLSM